MGLLDNKELLEDYRKHWSKSYGRELSDAELAEIYRNLNGFFNILWEWHSEDKLRPEERLDALATVLAKGCLAVVARDPGEIRGFVNNAPKTDPIVLELFGKQNPVVPSRVDEPKVALVPFLPQRCLWSELKLRPLA